MKTKYVDLTKVELSWAVKFRDLAKDYIGKDLIKDYLKYCDEQEKLVADRILNKIAKKALKI